MLYMHGKKISDIFINGKSLERGYLNGNLIFLKSKESKVFVDLWWQNDSGVITKEEITTITDLNNLCSNTSSKYTITLSNGHSFKNTDIVDFTFENSTNFPVTLPSNFGRKWTSLVMGSQSGSSVIRIPDKCTTIGDKFMYESSFAPTEFYLNNVSSLGNDFLSRTTFNCNIDLINVTSIGSNFLYNCMLFNKPITCYIENINSGFLSHNSSTTTNAFNSPLTLINTKTIADNFLIGQPSKHNIFNSTLVLPNTLESIGNRFLSDCDYSGIIDLSNTNISSIGNDFNSNGVISNILLPTINPLSIGNGFMSGHKGAIASTLIIPSNIIYIGDSFLFCSENYYTFSNIECNADPSTWANDGVLLSFSYTKYNENNMKYINVTGTYASEFIAKYPNSDANVSYDRARYYC